MISITLTVHTYFTAASIINNSLYIYKNIPSYATTMIFTLLFIVVDILIPTTNQPTTSSSIVSPSPNPLPQTRFFTITNFTAITEFPFKFGPHPHCPDFHKALNNQIFEQFEDTVTACSFTNANRTVIAADIVAVVCKAIVTTLEATNRADPNNVAPMINSLVLFLDPLDYNNVVSHSKNLVNS